MVDHHITNIFITTFNSLLIFSLKVLPKMKFKLYVLIAVFLIVLARGQAQDFLGNNDDNMSLEEQPKQNSAGARCMLRKPVTLSNNGPSSIQRIRTKYYYYSQSQGKCRSFYYFGIPPPGIFNSQNIFTSRLICQNTCHGSPYVITTTTTNNTNRVFQEHVLRQEHFVFEKSYIKNVATGLYVDAEGGSRLDNTNFILWNYKGSANQQFRLIPQPGSDGFWLVAAHSGECVTLSNGADLDNIDMIQWPCSGNNYQLWRRRLNNYRGAFSIYSNKGGKCLTGSTAAGSHVFISTCAHNQPLPANQLWTFVPVA